MPHAAAPSAASGGSLTGLLTSPMGPYSPATYTHTAHGPGSPASAMAGLSLAMPRGAAGTPTKAYSSPRSMYGHAAPLVVSAANPNGSTSSATMMQPAAGLAAPAPYANMQYGMAPAAPATLPYMGLQLPLAAAPLPQPPGMTTLYDATTREVILADDLMIKELQRQVGWGGRQAPRLS